MRRLMRFGVHALLARREGLAYTHVAWASIVALAYLLTQAADLGWLIAPTLLLYSALGVITLFDARYFFIPDIMIVFLAVCGGVVFLMIDANSAPIHAAAAIFAYAAFRAIAFLYYHFRGEAGLGLGDAKLFGVAGLWLGFEGLPTCLIVAVVSALASAAIIHRDTAIKSARLAIPFGPHLALGLWIVWAFGPLEHSWLYPA